MDLVYTRKLFLVRYAWSGGVFYLFIYFFGIYYIQRNLSIGRLNKLIKCRDSSFYPNAICQVEFVDISLLLKFSGLKGESIKGSLPTVCPCI